MNTPNPDPSNHTTLKKAPQAAFLAWAERELETQKKLLSRQLQRQWGL